MVLPHKNNQIELRYLKNYISIKHVYILNSKNKRTNKQKHWCYPNCLRLVCKQSRVLTLYKLCVMVLDHDQLAYCSKIVIAPPILLVFLVGLAGWSGMRLGMDQAMPIAGNCWWRCQRKSAIIVVDYSHEGSEGLYIELYEAALRYDAQIWWWWLNVGVNYA